MSIVIISAKAKVSSFILAFCIVVISSCRIFSPNLLSTSEPASPTQTEFPVFMSTISNTPTLTITPSPYATSVLTSTPPAEWVTNFAQPILDAIALRKPNFQDDFDDKSGGWQSADWCGEWRTKYQDGELVVEDCSARRSHIDYPDFVVELDGQFLKGATGNAGWAIYFRLMDGSAHYAFGIYDTIGTVGIWGSGNDFYQFPHAAKFGYETNRLLVIAKGSEFAFYVNGEPLYYMRDTKYAWGDIQLQSSGNNGGKTSGSASIVAFDNFKLWDISDISVP